MMDVDRNGTVKEVLRLVEQCTDSSLLRLVDLAAQTDEYTDSSLSELIQMASWLSLLTDAEGE